MDKSAGQCEWIVNLRYTHWSNMNVACDDETAGSTLLIIHIPSPFH
jgi:hypothetical protein